MRRLLATLSTSLTFLCLFAFPASACINDSEVNAKEREFKSQYQEDKPQYMPEPVYSPRNGQKLAPFAAVGVGSALLAGACVFCLKRK
jgi:hypothetical protein